ncbi:hypothetical protein ABWI01_03335 [Oceanicaulis alexandrii]|uniref:hypothetical protein n=1 Tax=Oceanicaulis alexandrii TaxID=153233 RepID=UPI0035CEB3C4
MSYYDHICCFSDRATAMAALPHLTGLDEEGVLRWTASVFEPLDLVTAEAVWGDADPVTGVRTTLSEQVRLPGFWCIVSLPAEDAAIKEHPGCKLIASRQLWAEQSPFGFLTWLDWDLTEFETVLSFSPAIAGVGYPFGG